jgi:hypothetical protein
MRTIKKLWNWSPAASVLGVLILVLWLSAVVWSQGQNFGTGGLAPNTPGIPSKNGLNIFYATNYGVKAGGYKFCDANVPAAGAIVTIGNDAQQNDSSLLTIGVQPGWIAWTSTWNCSGFNQSYAILNAVGTVTSVDSATQVHLSTSAATSCAVAAGGTVNKCILYLFPQDDTAAINAWFTAATTPNTCGVAHMWSGLAYWNGSGALIGATGCVANNTGNGSWPGVSVVGEGLNASVLVVSPNFNVGTSCTVSNPAPCLFTLPASSSFQNDIHLANFTIDGGGQRSPTGNASTKAALDLGADSSIENVGIFAWGIGNGLVTLGSDSAPVYVRNFIVAGAGLSGGFELNAGQATQIFGCNLFWGEGALANFNGSLTFGQTYSNGCQFGFGMLGAEVQVPASAYHVSVGDYYSNTPANTQDEINVAGTVDISGSNFGTATATGDVGIHVVSGGTAILHGQNYVNMLISGVGIKVDSGGTAFDFGHITNTSTTPYSIAGLFVPNPSETYAASMSLVGATGTGACATITTITGNIFTGSLKCTGTTGASTIVLTPGITATNGWTCTAADITTIANILTQSTDNATTCTINAPVAINANDVIAFRLTQF